MHSVTSSDEDWLRRYLYDYLTLDETAKLSGITREGVRQRLLARGLRPRGTAETLRLKEERVLSLNGDAIREEFLRLRSVAATASAADLPRSVVKRYLDAEVPDWAVLTRLPRDAAKKYSLDDLLVSLRGSAQDKEIALTTAAYSTYVLAHPQLDDGRARPGVQAMILRFGSWNAAVTAAGLKANPHGGPKKSFDAADAVNAVVECWREIGKPPSNAAYDAWQTGRDGRPSAATARKLFDSWLSLVLRSWQVVHGVLLDQEDDDVVVPADVLGDEQYGSALEGSVKYRTADEGVHVSLPDGYTVSEYNALERAVQSHAQLQNEVASAAGRIGLEARSPRIGGPAFDVALVGGDMNLVVEVKSATPENLELQLRVALGQVMIYAHHLREGSSSVSPVIAIELAPNESWVSLLASLGVGLVVAGTVEADLRCFVELSSASRSGR